MAVTVFVDVPAREFPSRAAALPSASDAERYLVPDPNTETLKNLLRFHGCPEFFVDTIADGYAPREYRPVMTRFWMLRDAFYRLATYSVHCFMGNALCFSLKQIVTLIIETMKQQDPSILELYHATNAVEWLTYHCTAGTLLWPSGVPCCILQDDLLTAIRLYVLYNIWCLNPAILLPVDFSAGLMCFSDAELNNIRSLINNEVVVLPPFMPSKPSALSTSVPSTNASGSILDADLQRLLDILQNGAKSATELEVALNVKRGVLRKRYLLPAEKKGLVEKTAPGSSSKQSYRLVPAACQVSPMAVTGATAPVTVDLKNMGKQVEQPGNIVSGIITVSRARISARAIRLARYYRQIDIEKALIKTFRVERFLRSAFVSNTWKELGIADKLRTTELFSVNDCLFNPKYWGAHGGLLLAPMQRDSNGNYCTFFLGESTLLSIFSRTVGLDLAACSETERAEMEKMEGVLSPAELYLTNYYTQHFGISRDLDKPYYGEKEAMQLSAVEPFNLYHPRMGKIVFHGKDEGQLLHVGRLDVAGRTLLLPIRFFASAKDPTLYCIMPEVLDRPALYNADAIAANPGATVILTDELGIPLVNDNDSDFIYCSWYGGVEVIDKLVLELPPGHQYRWLCFDNGIDPAEKYEKAMRVKAIFQKHGLKIAFQVFDGVTWTNNAFFMETGTYESSRDVSFDDLKVEAAKYGVDVGESIAVAPTELRIYSMDELMKLKPKDFVLYPLLKEGFYCLIYGGTGVAKTWLALHLAISLTQGIAPFDKWEFRGKGPLDVLYVAGEMKPEEYGKRIKELLDEQEKSNPHFGLVREDIDLTKSEDQERVINTINKHGSQVVVFDNLSTLAMNGHTEGQFEKVLALIRKLQADGITVILVHHENREGGFKGSGKIELVADQSLHLFPAGNGDKIELLVRAEKIRMTSRAEQTAFHTEFDPNQPTEVWPTRSLKKEERRRLDEDDPLGEVEMNVGKKRNDKRLAWRFLNDDDRAIAIIDDTLSGCRDDVIAANLAVREIAIVEFKQQFGITEDALNHHLPMARELAEKNEGKITPNALASEIWKRLKPKD
jgi:KaiC/GvpD/RAD55 family RecA-like ATPase